MSGFVRPKPIPFILSFGGILFMLTLGVWQLDRLAWKEDLIARIDTAAKEAPLTQLPSTPEALQDKHFYSVELTGYYMNQPEFDIAARYFNSKLGYSILTPFIIDEGPDTGKIVLVNRGWIPAALKDDASARKAITDEKITIRGRIRLSNERNRFTPQNQPERNVWFGRDVADMAAFSQLQFEPLTLDITGVQDPAILPVPSDETVQLRNDHLGYAITWFGIGIGMLVITLLYHRKPKDDA